jgi:hypothetical protein
MQSLFLTNPMLNDEIEKKNQLEKVAQKNNMSQPN